MQNISPSDLCVAGSVGITKTFSENQTKYEIEIKPSKEGAKDGAIAGAIAGSPAGPVGMVVGGIIGGVVGYIFGPADEKKEEK